MLNQSYHFLMKVFGDIRKTVISLLVSKIFLSIKRSITFFSLFLFPLSFSSLFFLSLLFNYNTSGLDSSLSEATILLLAAAILLLGIFYVSYSSTPRFHLRYACTFCYSRNSEARKNQKRFFISLSTFV